MAAPSSEPRAGLAACLGWVLGIDPADVPAPAGPDGLPAIRGWLARRNLGLAPVADAASFALPGFWLGRIRDAGAAGGAPPARWVVLFGVPSGVVFDPGAGARGGAEPDPGEPAVEAGFVLAQLDPSPARRQADPAPGPGHVEAVLVATRAEGPMRFVPEAAASPAGLDGDRYAAGAGTFSSPSATGTALTLVEGEALGAVILPDGGPLGAEEARRNVVTRGIALDGLVGRRFMVGGVACFGQRLCEPCAHWQRLTRPGVLRGFVHRGGLRADVLTAGVVRVGDAVRVLE